MLILNAKPLFQYYLQLSLRVRFRGKVEYCRWCKFNCILHINCHIKGKKSYGKYWFHNLYLLLQLISGMRRKEKHWTSNFFHLPRTTFILKNILIVVNSQMGAGVGQIMRLIAITTSVLCAVHWQNSKKHTAEYKFMGRQDMSRISSSLPLF